MKLPRNRVNGSRMKRAGVNTKQIICRDLAEVSGTVRSNRFLAGRTLINTCSRAARGSSTLRLFNLLSSNNIRDRVGRIVTLVGDTGRGNIGGLCLRTFLSNHSISPRTTPNCVRAIRGTVRRVKLNRVTAISNHCCTVSHSGH